MTRKDAVVPSALGALLILSSLLMFAVPRTSAAGPLTPQGILYYVPITLTNGQAAATPSPFQAMIQVNSHLYSNYEANDLRNIEFFAADGSIIPSWLESGSSVSSTATIYWLKLSGGIAAASSRTIYMGFASSGTNLLNNQVTGEAPQVSNSYGQYDNGANIFSYYAQFGGLSGSALPFGWQTDNVAYVNVRDHSTYSQLRFTDKTSAGTGAHVYTVSTPSSVTAYPAVMETFMSVSSYPSAGEYEVFGDLGNPGTQTMTAAVGYGKTCSGGVSGGNFYFMTGGTACLPTYQSPDNNNHVFSILLSSASSLNVTLIDYTAVTGSAGIIPQTNHNFGFGGGASTEGAASLNVYWVRTRAYPPSGVMVGAQFGTIAPVPPESVTVSCTPTSLVIGTSSTCTATVVGNSPTGTFAWTTSGTGTFSSATCILSSGSCQTSYTPSNAASPVTVTATYSGDTYNQPISGTYSLTVSKVNTNTTATCGSLPVTIGTPVTCTAQVTGDSPSGFVSFTSSGGSFQPTSCTLSSGRCAVSFTPSSAGSLQVTAFYDGDSNNQVSSGSASLVVVRASTSTSITCVPSSVAVGTSTSCLATVTGGYSPSGSVIFVSTSGSGTFTPANNCTLSSGTCQVSYFDSLQGTPQIIGVYGGDSDNGGSQGSALLVIGSPKSSTSSSASVASSSTSTTGGGGGAIPEFPTSLAAVAVSAVLVLVAYAAVRHRSERGPAPV